MPGSSRSWRTQQLPSEALKISGPELNLADDGVVLCNMSSVHLLPAAGRDYPLLRHGNDKP